MGQASALRGWLVRAILHGVASLTSSRSLKRLNTERHNTPELA